MSKGKKQQYKQFAINNLEEGCFVLKTLIVPVIVGVEKYKRYSNEAEDLLKEYASEKCIPAYLYESVHDKLLYTQRELLQYIADHQNSSFSYIGVRKLLFKKKYLARELAESSSEILNELLIIRNWTFHNVQSMLVAQMETAKKSIPKEFAGMVDIKPMLNPVVINDVESYSKEMLESFIVHNRIRYKQFAQILEEMKKDYQEMYDALPNRVFQLTKQGFSCEIQYMRQKINDLDHKVAGADIAELSMKIQKGKYDGEYSRLFLCGKYIDTGKVF